jgi:hypothetical protein
VRHKAKQIKAEAILGADPQQARQVRRFIPTLQWFIDQRFLPFVKGYKRSWKTDETVLRACCRHSGSSSCAELHACAYQHCASAVRSVVESIQGTLWERKRRTRRQGRNPSVQSDSPQLYGAEYNTEWRSDLQAFVSREAVEDCVVEGRYELAPIPDVHYQTFVDPSGGASDSTPGADQLDTVKRATRAVEDYSYQVMEAQTANNRGPGSDKSK